MTMGNYFTENFKSDVVWMTVDDFDVFPEVIHAFTTRYGDISEGIYEPNKLEFRRRDDPERVEENCRIVCSALGIDERDIVATRQIHSDIVRKVSSADKEQEINDPASFGADALITNERGLALSIFVADCIPVLFYAEDCGAIGAAHAGWRGTVADIVGKTIKALCVEYGCEARNIHAVIGAGIGVCCFETGREVYDAVEALGLECDMDILAVDDQNGRYHIDLKEVNRRLLVRAGVPEENISVNQECTCCLSDKYWSHRATNGKRGVQAALIALR